MHNYERKARVELLAAVYDPKNIGAGSPFDLAYRKMVRAGIPISDRMAIGQEARKLYATRQRQAAERACNPPLIVYDNRPTRVPLMPTRMWSFPVGGTEYAKYVEEHVNGLLNIGPRLHLVQQLRQVDAAFIKFNYEGEKQMEKIDWHKPLRALNNFEEPQPENKVHTYKSGKQRVVWVDDRVYPVDEQGRMVATVQYPGRGLRTPGQKIVENVPEEKFFLGLVRGPSGTYWLTDGGVPTTMSVLNCWKGIAGQMNWIVDTRKPAEPPKAVVHDPEDWTTVFVQDGETYASGLMTKAEAEVYVSEPGEQVVRVRTTPAPVDTARYIQLWRESTSCPWRINALGTGRQEFTWAATQHRGVSRTRTAIKVRD